MSDQISDTMKELRQRALANRNPKPSVGSASTPSTTTTTTTTTAPVAPPVEEMVVETISSGGPSLMDRMRAAKPMEAKKDLDKIGAGPDTVALAVMMHYHLDKEIAGKFASSFANLKDIKAFFMEGLNIIQNLRQWNPDVDKAKEVAKFELYHIKQISDSLKVQNVDITPFNIVSEVIACPSVKAIQDGDAVIFESGSVKMRVIRGEEREWYRDLANVIKQGGKYTPAVAYRMTDYVDEVYTGSCLVLFHFQVLLENNILTFKERSGSRLPVFSTGLRVTPDEAMFLYEEGKQIAVSMVKGMHEKSWIGNPQRILSIVYAASISYGVTPMSRVKEYVETVRAAVDLRVIVHDDLDVSNDVDAMLDNQNDDLFNAAHASLEAARAYREPYRELNEETHDSQTVGRCLHINDDYWGFLHIMSVIDVAREMVKEAKDGEVEGIYVHGSTGREVARGLRMNKVAPKIGWHSGGAPRILPGTEIGPRLGDVFESMIATDENYRKSLPEKDVPKKALGVFVIHDYVGYEVKTTDNTFADGVVFLLDGFKKATRTGSVLVLSHNLCKAETYEKFYAYCYKNQLGVRVHRHPRLHNDKMYYLVSNGLEFGWDIEQFIGARVKMMRQIIDNNIMRDLSMALGVLPRPVNQSADYAPLTKHFATLLAAHTGHKTLSKTVTRVTHDTRGILKQVLEDQQARRTPKGKATDEGEKGSKKRKDDSADDEMSIDNDNNNIGSGGAKMVQ